jgi:hypothetical protein
MPIKVWDLRKDNAWRSLRDVLWQVRESELAWNALAPRAVPVNLNK